MVLYRSILTQKEKNREPKYSPKINKNKMEKLGTGLV